MAVSNQTKWIGVRPTDPEGNPHPVHIEDASGNVNSPTVPVYTQDSGLHTNPRQYEKTNGFYSAVVTSAAAAVALWTTATTPARTTLLITTIYNLHIENATGGAITAWLEVAGTAITIPYHVANNDSICIPWEAGFNVGDQDIDFNASVAGVTAYITGTEA